MIPKALKLICTFAGVIWTTSCAEDGRSMTLISSASGHPVEGALVYAPGDLTVYRSDVHGRAEVPAGYGAEGIRVFAKNHGTTALEPDFSGGEVILQFDESLVNPREARMVFDRADTLRGSYGPFRENNDLLSYALDVRVDVEKRFLEGANTVTFSMLQDGSRIQLDLFENLSVDSILSEGARLSFAREFNALFVDFPQTLRAGERHSVTVYYSGYPREAGRFGGISFETDSLGNPWVYTACQNIGASVWWPNKDQQPDEVESMTLRVTVPPGVMDVSNGRLMAVEEGEDGWTTYEWAIHYPINNYSVALNIGAYEHFSDSLGALPLDFYALPYHMEDARRQFAQAKPMIQCFTDRFGEYSFPLDGYKLVEVPYSGMEHQSAVAYGNLFENGYLGRDWTGVGISPRFDFIIVHESAHEWFGNSVTANDVSDAWIHEGFGTYAEGVYVECMWGYEDALTYLNGYQAKVGNREPIIGPPGVNHWPTQDQYFKGALFLNTLRHVVDDDPAWWALLQDYYQEFKYRDIWTTDVINFFNANLQQDLRPVFQQYLYYWRLPVLELEFQEDQVRFRWQADVQDFDMPVKVRIGEELETLYPTSEWTSRALNGVSPDQWQPATDLFYIQVDRIGSDPGGPSPSSP